MGIKHHKFLESIFLYQYIYNIWSYELLLFPKNIYIPKNEEYFDILSSPLILLLSPNNTLNIPQSESYFLNFTPQKLSCPYSVVI